MEISLEEKEAIKLLKKDSTDWCYRSIDVRNSVKVALNYIDKLQKENKDLELAYGLYKDTADKLQKENEDIKEYVNSPEFLDWHLGYKTIDELEKRKKEINILLEE